MANWIISARVESLGDDTTTATNREWRWSSGTPTGGTASWRSLHLPYLEDKLPSEIATSIDFRAGAGSIGALSLSLLNLDAVSTRFYRNSVQRIGRLRTTVSATATTWVIEDKFGVGIAGLAVGTGLALEREVATITADLTGGSYTVTRGRLGTLKQSHTGRSATPAGTTADTEIYNADHGHLLTDRVLVLSRVPSNGTEADEEVVFRGVISGISDSGATIRVQTRTIVELLTRRKLFTDLWRVDLKPTTTGAYGLNFSHGPPAHLGVNGDGDRVLPLTLGGGKHAVINRYSPQSATSRPKLNVSGFPNADTQPFDDAQFPSDVRVAEWDGLRAHEFFTLSDKAPSIDAAGNVYLGQDGTTGEKSNGFSLLLQMLLTTPTGDNGPTGYDLGDLDTPRVAGNIGIGAQAALIDVDAIETVRARTPHKLLTLNMGADGKPIDDIYAWIQQKLMRPFGCVLTVGEGFKLTVVKLESAARADTPSLVESDFAGIPTGDRKMDTVFDRVVVEYNDQIGIGTVKENFTDAINRQRLTSGRHKETSIDASGIRDRSSVVNLITGSIQRYHHPLPSIRFTLLNTKNYWPGQLLSITHSKIMGTDGTKGVTAGTFLVVGRRMELMGAVIHYDAIYVGAIFGRQGLISGCMEMDGAGSGVTHLVELNSSTVNPGPNDAVQFDVDAFAVGDVVKLLNRDHSPATDATTRTIETITSPDTITVNAAWSPAAANTNLIVPADYDATTAAQKALWTWMAGGDDTLGSGSDDPYEWDI